MKYFRIVVGTPYAGTDAEEYVAYEDDENAQKFAEEYAEELCDRNAEGFEYLVTGWDCDADEYDDYEEEIESYYQDCDWYVEEITKEEYEENR